ncbi:hypothetical protein Ac2012v2_002404 [Leucoagaricus gongylophorus]
MKLSFVVVSSFFTAIVTASNVVELTPDNFDNIIGQGKPALVEFFAPWCGHCKNLAPIYEQLADAFSHAKDRVVIAKVDADGVGKPLGNKYDVKGFPTLKWFDAAGEHEKYESGRDLDSLVAFVTQKSGVKSSIKPPPPPETTILDVYNFDEIVMDPSKNILVSFTVSFFARSCGAEDILCYPRLLGAVTARTSSPLTKKVSVRELSHKHHRYQTNKVAHAFKPESSCVVANMDADDAKNKDIARKYDVSSFPTIKFFSMDNKDGIPYEGGRSEADFVNYLNEKCGTQRKVGGGLNDRAGRLSSLDSLAHRFTSAGHASRQAIIDDARTLLTSFPAAEQYLKFMEKVVNKGHDYIEKEHKRLTSILEKKTLMPVKLDELQIKANVLRAFFDEPKTEEEIKVAREEAEL